MPMVFGAIAPHGFPIIPDLSDDAEGAMATREAMFEFGRRLAAAKPDVVVIATPHGVRVDGAVTLANVSRGAGTLFWDGKQLEQNIPVDGPLTDAIAAAAAEHGVPVALTGFAGNRRDQSVIPLDWGVITPAWFGGHDRNMVGHGHPLAANPAEDIGPPVVIVNPSRSMPRQKLIDFGEAVVAAADKDGRRVAFVASCDWGHCHKESGPYGYHEASARVDQMVVEAIKEERLGDLVDLSEKDASEAAIDGLWQTLMLEGVLRRSPMAVDFLTYEAPSYYGMIVALYEPASV